MVAVQMRNEDGLYFREVHLRAAHLYLGSLSAIYHKELATYFYYLASCIMMERGQGTSTAQYVYLERYHAYFLRPNTNIPALFSSDIVSAPSSITSKVSLDSRSLPLYIFHDVHALFSA